MSVAVLMAGGRSERMRATQGPVHKTLVPVVGVPLLERNLLYVISHGFQDVVVAINHAERDLEEFLLSRGRAIAEATGSNIKIQPEHKRMGTIGAAGECGDPNEISLIVNADNLTSISLKDLVAHHLSKDADLTISVHSEAFQIPFGELVCEGGLVMDYKEKSTRSIPISSGVYVVGPRARRHLIPEKPLDVPDLFRLVRSAGGRVSAYEHKSLWIDINDAETLRSAEQLVVSHPDAFEWIRAAPDRTMGAMMCVSPEGVFVIRHREPSANGGSAWQLPCFDLEPTRGIVEGGGLQGVDRVQGLTSDSHVITSFDEIDTGSGEVTRYKILLVEGTTAIASDFSQGHEGRWVRPELIYAGRGFDAPAVRAAAALRVARA